MNSCILPLHTIPSLFSFLPWSFFSLHSVFVENKTHCWDRKILAQMILLSSLCLREKRNPLLGQKNSKSNNHIDMVWRVLLTGMDQKREKLIIGEKKESELLYTISTRLLLFFCIYFYTTNSSFSASPTPIFSLSLIESLTHSTEFFFLSRTQCHDVAAVDEAVEEAEAVLLLLVSLRCLLRLFHNHHLSLHRRVPLLLRLSHRHPRWLNWPVVSKRDSICRIERLSLRPRKPWSFREGLATEASERKSKSEQIIFSSKSPIEISTTTMWVSHTQTSYILCSFLCFYAPKLLLIILFHIFYFTLIF